MLRELPGDASVVFAYGPVWAIGADRPATSEHVRDVLHVLRAHLPDDNNRLRFIYGGSAGPGLYKELSDTVDGLFLGRSAHDPRAFAEVLDEMLSVSRHAEVNAKRASETPQKPVSYTHLDVYKRQVLSQWPRWKTLLRASGLWPPLPPTV